MPKSALIGVNLRIIPLIPIHALINARNFLHPLPPVTMLQTHHLIMRPVKVVSDEGYLLLQLVEGVA
ncbi:MAG: hypothetical protein KA314_02880 [Chloroflexi bacterium]|nr:hypothetical protein [Chloroflexota bacterium]